MKMEKHNKGGNDGSAGWPPVLADAVLSKLEGSELCFLMLPLSVKT